MAIHLDASATGWEKPVQWFYRVLALAWLAKGFLGWANLVALDAEATHFVAFSSWIYFFDLIVVPILDIIAGVALWISWRWGAGVWALTALGFVGLEFFGAASLRSPALTGIAVVLLFLHGMRLVLLRSKNERQITIV
jgi:hypothetical protein